MSASYQSPGAQRKRLVGRLLRVGSLALAGALMMGAKPYDDGQGRFSIQLPEAWSLSPGLGDMLGMRFARTTRRGESTFLVHVDPLPADDLTGFIRAIESRHRRDRVYNRVGASAWRVEGGKGKCRTYVAGRKGAPPAERRRIKACFMRANDRFFHLRAEAPAGDFRLIEDELRLFFSSFVPGGDQTADCVPPEVEGEWVSGTGARLSLFKGRFILGPRKGRFSLRCSTLILKGKGRALEFSATVTGGGQRLILSSPRLEKPLEYTKKVRRASSRPTKTDSGQTAPLPRAKLAGAYKAVSDGQVLVLNLDATGKFSLGPLSGTWSHTRTQLELRGSGGERITYGAERVGSSLTLRGGDLDQPLVFEKISER